jgi:hypothetical protein
MPFVQKVKKVKNRPTLLYMFVQHKVFEPKPQRVAALAPPT